MRLIVTILPFIFFISQIGCKSAKTVHQTTERSDSTSKSIDKKETFKDSTFFSKDVKENVIEKAETNITLSQDSLNALIELLKNLPKGTVIHKTDPKSQVQLTIALNEIGKLKIGAASAEKRYNETTITQGRIVESLKNEIEKRDHIISNKETIIKEQQKNIIQKVSGFIENGIWFLLFVGVLIIGIRIFLKKKLT